MAKPQKYTRSPGASKLALARPGDPYVLASGRLIPPERVAVHDEEASALVM